MSGGSSNVSGWAWFFLGAFVWGPFGFLAAALLYQASRIWVADDKDRGIELAEAKPDLDEERAP